MIIGTIIVADVQTDAIGTHGRRWYTTRKDNIAFSLVIYPEVEIAKLDNVTIRIAQILLEIFEKLYKIKLDIKAPNDLMIKNRKVGGILCETKLQGKTVKYLVVGIGINTNQEEFEEGIENIATSIKNEYGIRINNSEIIKEFYNKFVTELNEIINK